MFCRIIKPLLLVAMTGLTAHVHATTGNTGVNWTLRNPFPMNESLNGVACNGDINTASTALVVVGSHGVILSASASTGPWTLRASTTTENLNAVAWSHAENSFVVVGDKGSFLTSTDGTTWTKRDLVSGTAPTTQVATEDLTCVTWTGARFFVGGNGSAGAVVYGVTDPTTTWSKFPNLGAGTKIHAVTGTSNYVFGFTDTKLFEHSSNALPASPWSQNAWPPGESYIQGAVYTIQGPNAGSVISGSKIYTSSYYTSTSWTPLTDVTDSNLNLTWTLSSSGSEIVGVGANGAVWKSSTGSALSWTKLPVVEQGLQLHAGVKFGAGYVVVGDGGRIYSYSGTAWTSGYSTGGIDNLTAVGVNGSKLVALAKNVLPGTNASFLSTDNGTTWTRTATTVDATSVAGVGGAGFIATGNGIWSSADGVTWTLGNPSGFAGRLNRVTAFGTGQAIAVGADTGGTALASQIYQYDGTTWTKAVLGVASSNLELRGAAVSPALTVAVGDGGLVLTLPSGTGKLWARHTVALAKGEGFTDVLAAGAQFLASTSLGGVWSSTDGVVWTKRLGSASAAIQRLVDTNNITEQFIGVGGLGTTIRSFGGSYWYESNTGTSQSFTDAVWSSGTTLVAVGAHGTIMTSGGAEPPRPTLSFMVPTSSFGEGAGTVPVTVQLSSPSPLPVTVAYTSSGTGPGVATQGNTATSDYSLPTPQVLAFAPGETSKTISVAIKQDTLVEGNETVTLTLSAPTGDAALDLAKIQHVLTIVDDDVKPYFPLPVNQPQNQLVNVGSALTLTATAGGNVQPTAQWKKNNANVVGATLTPTLNATPLPATTTFTCRYSGALTTLAGAYTVLFTNQAGTQLSSVAQVGVVDNTPKTIVLAENGTASLSVNASGTGLTYQWMRANGGMPITIADTLDKRILGSRTAKLSIKTIGMLEADTYYCVVTQAPPSGTSPPPALTITGGTTVVRVVNLPPTVSAVVFPVVNNVVSQAFDFLPTASFYPYKWAVTGLPPGLSFDAATGHITGSTLRAGDYVITFTATNAVGDSTVMTSTLTIAPLPAGVTGMFMGLLAPQPGKSAQAVALVQAVLNHSLGARLDLMVTDTSLFSGKLTYGTLATAFTGALTYNPPPVDPVPPPPGYVNPGVTFTGSAALKPAGFPAVTMNFTIFPSSCPTTPNTVSVTLTDGATTPNVSTFSGWRNMWLSLTPSLATTVSNYTGVYHLAMGVAYYYQQGIPFPDVPLGYSIAAFTLASDGTLAMSGQMADGTPFSSAGFINATGSGLVLPIYAGLYSNTGAVNGLMALVAGVDKSVTPNVTNYEYNTLANAVVGSPTVFWTKNVQPSSVTNYPGGFGTPSQVLGTFPAGLFNGNLSVFNASGRYTPPQSPTEIVMGLPPGQNAQIKFTDGGVTTEDPYSTPVGARLQVSALNPDVGAFTVRAPAAVAIPVGGGASSTLNFVPSTGTFNGTFTLVDVPFVGQPSITRNVNFNGIIIGHRNVAKGDGSQEAGYGSFQLLQLPSAGSNVLSGGVRMNRILNFP